MEQYSAALDIRDAREKAHKPFIDACTITLPHSLTERLLTSHCMYADTKLADRTAAAASTPSSAAPATPPPATATTDPSTTSAATTQKLQTDLLTAQKARSTLLSSLSTLELQLTTLRSQTNSLTSQLNTSNSQKAALERKLRDREEELRQKKKFADDAQDEVVALQLQLNLAEEKGERVRRENEELVRRWVERMGVEVERVNREEGWDS